MAGYFARRNRRKSGWKKNPIDGRDLSFLQMGLGDSSLPSIRTLHDECKVMTQRSTSSCVAHSVASSIYIREVLAGLDPINVSRLFIYYNARRFSNRFVFDTGTHIRDAVKGVVKFGVPDEKHWRFSTNPGRVNLRPGWKPYMMGNPRKHGKYYRIFETGDERCEAIKRAICDGHPVIFGTPIDKDFIRNGGPSVIEKPATGSKIVGGHAMTIIGYKETKDGLLFEILNSWGADWRDGGFAFLTDDFIKWYNCVDFTIMDGWDRIASV